MRSSMFEMGVSVLGGGVTTFGASVFLLITKLEFFNVFGVFMCSTISLSLAIAIFFFNAIMLTPLGPNEKTGKLF